MPHDHFYTNEKVKFKTESTSALYKSISANSLTANGYDKETIHNNNFVLEKKPNTKHLIIEEEKWILLHQVISNY